MNIRRAVRRLFTYLDVLPPPLELTFPNSLDLLRTCEGSELGVRGGVRGGVDDWDDSMGMTARTHSLGEFLRCREGKMAKTPLCIVYYVMSTINKV